MVYDGIYSPIHVPRLKITYFEPKKHIMNLIGLGKNAVSYDGIYSPIHGIRLKICEFEPKKHIMNYLGLGKNAVCTGR